ncbi:MAG: hypothetical protein ACRDKZ_08725 [Actinomycetota bacterium]
MTARGATARVMERTHSSKEAPEMAIRRPSAPSPESLPVQVTVDPRFAGPPGVGNGGYVAGLLAEHLAGPIKVRLHAPVPVASTLELEADGAVRLAQGGRMLAEATPGEAHKSVPRPVSFAEAVEARAGTRSPEDHPFPRCFVCGPERAPCDGLRLLSAWIPGRDVMATPWRPADWLADSSGVVATPHVWAALDCPSYWPLARPGEVALLGQLEGETLSPVMAGRPHVVMSWAEARNGRKMIGGSAVLARDGQLLAAARGTSIRIDSPGP